MISAACLALALAAPTAAEGPLATLPYSPSLDPAAMDPSAAPCTDFYQYACGGWMKANPIPEDQASWSVYGKLAVDDQRFLRGILRDLAKPDPARTAPQQKIGDFFAACMDEGAVEGRGAAPLRPWLDAIDGLRSLADLPPLLARLHLATMGFYDDALLFGFGAQQDYADSSHLVASADSGGLGLPDRDYYFRKDAKSAELRRKYRAHVQAMLQLLGSSPGDAARQAGAVFRIEEALAGATLTEVEKRDPRHLDHTLTVAELQKLTPAFDWSAYLKALGLDGLAKLNVSEPRFEARLQEELATVPLADWKSYLRWHVARAAAPYLSRPFVDAHFDFYRHTLRGVPSLRPRWKRCVAWTDGLLGEALGQEFVRRTFTADTKQRAADMTRRIEAAMQADLEGLGWMGPATRAEALSKLHAVVNKIGYPDRWRDYGPVQVAPDDFFGDVLRAQTFESRRWMRKIGKPVDRGEWFMSPPTVNAYYDGQMNDIDFPAGVLQPPLFDVKLDDAPNYGDTGSTIGHELTHGFDDEGRQFDAKGNLRDWWTPADAKAFERRAQCVVDQYGKYTVVDDVRINSKLTEGEDIADLGGTVLAYEAWQRAEAGKRRPAIGGFTPEQRFFIGFAQWACENQRPENLRANAYTNPHSPGRYRVDGVVANLPEFRQAFACKAGSPMVNPEPCKVW